MRAVNQITWDLVRQEFDIPKVEKGESVYIVKACNWNNKGFCIESDVNFKKIKAR